MRTKRSSWWIAVHADGRAIFVDVSTANDVSKPPQVVDELVVIDGRRAAIRCVGPTTECIGKQWVELRRLGRLAIERHTSKPIRGWHMDYPTRQDRTFVWSDGVQLHIDVGDVTEVDDTGYVESPIHYSGMKFADPCPHEHQTVEVTPVDGVIRLSIRRPVSVYWTETP